MSVFPAQNSNYVCFLKIVRLDWHVSLPLLFGFTKRSLPCTYVLSLLFFFGVELCSKVAISDSMFSSSLFWPIPDFLKYLDLSLTQNVSWLSVLLKITYTSNMFFCLFIWLYQNEMIYTTCSISAPLSKLRLCSK
jgi:hypothetical protein